jgi:hypothetical protein
MPTYMVQASYTSFDAMLLARGQAPGRPVADPTSGPGGSQSRYSNDGGSSTAGSS